MKEEMNKKLFMSLVTEEGLPKILEEKIFAEEYNLACNGGEPDMEHLLCVRLRESLVKERAWFSILYNDEWRELALKEK